MRQYLDVKEKHKDSIVFFRLGDFYEMFFDDAKLVSEELDLTLTGRDYGQKERAPMCGVPYHSSEAYISRLISKGYKIAICEQVENPSEARGLVRREVVRVITPGTIIEGSMLDESRNNYICSIYYNSSERIAGISFCDVSTGELKVSEIFGQDDNLISQIKIELGKFGPREILYITPPDIYRQLASFLKEKLSNCSAEVLEEKFDDQDSINYITKHFKLKNLNQINLESKNHCIKSLVYLIEYLKNTQKGSLNNIGIPMFYDRSDYMGLDLNTIRNLELMETMRTGSKRGSLLGVLDKTKTAMGKRLLRTWIERPLINKEQILARQDSVSEFIENPMVRSGLTELLSGVHDIQRIMTKITYSSANARDLKTFSNALAKLPHIKSLLECTDSKFLRDKYLKFDVLEDIYELINSSIADDPPTSLKEGNIIKTGYDKQIDNYRKDIYETEDLINSIEQRERESTGIPKLKINYNKIFGYYIEVTNSYKKLVPDSYTRKQTLSNCERYTTIELKELEARVLTARERICDAEYKVFEEIRNKVAENFTRVTNTSSIIAIIDVLQSLALVASTYNYVKPEIQDPGVINIKQGRHPVVEALVKDTDFVPNDILLDTDENTVAIITGPNMAGKSTYMRQTALAVLLAQMGSFVPAECATIGIVDNIFTRIGASDDLASGQSTFMIEMNEVAEIMKNATHNSLLILDEIGRGTSTFDGMSIARAVLEFVADPLRLGAKTLFATHYHELTSITDEIHNIKNYNIAVKKIGDDIVFLRTISLGAADDSYGIEVAKLAGIPNHIISRAKEILFNLEHNLEKNPQFTKYSNITNETFDYDSKKEILKYKDIIQELRELNIDAMTPITAFSKLSNLHSLCLNR